MPPSTAESERTYLKAHIQFVVCVCTPFHALGCADCKIKSDMIMATIEKLGWSPPPHGNV